MSSVGGSAPEGRRLTGLERMAAKLAAMTPEQRAEHDRNVAASRAAIKAERAKPENVLNSWRSMFVLKYTTPGFGFCKKFEDAKREKEKLLQEVTKQIAIYATARFEEEKRMLSKFKCEEIRAYLARTGAMVSLRWMLSIDDLVLISKWNEFVEDGKINSSRNDAVNRRVWRRMALCQEGRHREMVMTHEAEEWRKITALAPTEMWTAFEKEQAVELAATAARLAAAAAAPVVTSPAADEGDGWGEDPFG